MRLGTFLFGGICGAAAIMYLNKKSKNLMLSSFFNTGSSAGKMTNKATNMAGQAASTAMAANSPITGQGVNAFANGEPKLKQTVNEILASNSLGKTDPASITV